jgi:ABC-type phosphate transport system permease subunit
MNAAPKHDIVSPEAHLRPKSRAFSAAFGSVYVWISASLLIFVCLFIFVTLARYGLGRLSWDFLSSEPNASVRDLVEINESDTAYISEEAYIWNNKGNMTVFYGAEEIALAVGEQITIDGMKLRNVNGTTVKIQSGGILTPLIGTLLLTLLGIIAALPFALATAIYLCFYAKKGPLRALVESAIDILAGVPTIVIALFSLTIFVLPQFGFLSTMIKQTEFQVEIGASQEVYDGILVINDETEGMGAYMEEGMVMLPPGQTVEVTAGVHIKNSDGITVEVDDGDPGMAYGRSFLVAAITMAIMILPFVIKSMAEAIKSVPQEYLDGSYALGSKRWRTINKIALRCARPGLITGIALGMGRIVGDTAIVWLSLGGVLRMTGMQPWYAPENWLSTLKNTGSTLTSYIYYASPAGEGDNLETAFGASFVLICIIVILNIGAALLGGIGKDKS